MDENDLFSSSDLSLVAFLRCYGAVIEGVDRTNPRAVFYIRREIGMDQLVQGFFAHSIQVDPLTYFNALKEAKSRLYEARSPLAIGRMHENEKVWKET